MFICQTSQSPWYRSLDFNSALLEKSRNDQFKQTKMKLNQITKLTRKLNSISPHDRLHFIQSVYNPPPTMNPSVTPAAHQTTVSLGLYMSCMTLTYFSATPEPLLLIYSYSTAVPPRVSYLIMSSLHWGTVQRRLISSGFKCKRKIQRTII